MTRKRLTQSILVLAFLAMPYQALAEPRQVPPELKRLRNTAEFMANLARRCHASLSKFGRAGVDTASCHDFRGQLPVFDEAVATIDWGRISALEKSESAKSIQQRSAWATYTQDLAHDVRLINKVKQHLEFFEKGSGK